ncbi:MAG: hypothetical protein QF815_03510, partial [Candidatus Peribacteraceae bacterium]|nr:hypothetical protein [Candidatus Peribacteraceae bacterium]
MPQFYTEEEAVTAIRKLISQKMLQFARRTAHEALREYSDSRQIRYLNAFISSELKDYATASVLLEQLNNEDPGKIEILKSLINTWTGLGEMNKAIGYNNNLEELTGREDQAILTNADIYERNNKIEEAEEELSKLPSNILEQTHSINIRARLLISKKEYEQAVDLILKYEDKLPELEELSQITAFFMLTKAYDKLGEYDKAWEAAAKAHSLSTFPFDIDNYFKQFAEVREFMSREIVEALVEGPTT